MKHRNRSLLKNIYFLFASFSISIALITYIFLNHPDRASFELINREEKIVFEKKTKVKFITRQFTDIFFQSKKSPTKGITAQSLEFEYPDYGYYRYFITAFAKNKKAKTEMFERLYLPNSLKEQNLSIKEAFFFLSSFHHSFFDNQIEKPVTRLQAAFTLNQLAGPLSVRLRQRQFRDYSMDSLFSKEVNRAVTNKWLVSLPTAFFYPDKFITKQDFILAIVKVLNLPLEYTVDDQSIFKNLNPLHWTYPYIVSAYKAKIISDKDIKNINDSLSQKDFANVMINIPRVKLEIEELSQNPIIPISKLEHISSLNKRYPQKHLKLAPQIIAHQLPEDIFIEENAFKLNAKIINPRSKFVIVNQRKLQLSNQFEFELEVPLFEGENKIYIDHENTEKVISIWKLPKLKSYKNHWSEETVRRLVALGLLDKNTLFKPNQTLRRIDFSIFLAQILKLKGQETEKLPFQDLLPYQVGYSEVSMLYQNEILKGTGSMFMPQKKLSKLEALVAIMRANQLQMNQENKILPFKDIGQKLQWARPYLEKALEAKLISEAPYFYPNKPVTFSEFVTLIYRSKNIQEIIRRAYETNS